ncbi:MAG: hypothetical protein Tsb009_04740 [Planctomycetaceae bacterium]
MSYFSRLTDIVTCNLSEILAQESDPQSAIQQIIAEMEEGRAGAQRAVNTAKASEERIRNEIEEFRAEISRWASQARTSLADGEENQARLALLRKQEAQDVVEGLEQQHQAALATVEHLSTTLRALEARLADAQRKSREMDVQNSTEAADPSDVSVSKSDATSNSLENHPRSAQIEAELEALKKELEKG